MEKTVHFHRRKVGGSPKSELLALGYRRRTTAAEPRLSEIVAEYRRIGFDVEVIEHRVEPDSCGICFDAQADSQQRYCDVYVRPRPPVTKDTVP